MGSAEIRDGPIGLFADVLHVRVGTDIATRIVFFQGGKVPLKSNTGIWGSGSIRANLYGSVLYAMLPRKVLRIRRRIWLQIAQ